MIATEIEVICIHECFNNTYYKWFEVWVFFSIKHAITSLSFYMFTSLTFEKTATQSGLVEPLTTTHVHEVVYVSQRNPQILYKTKHIRILTTLPWILTVPKYWWIVQSIHKLLKNGQNKNEMALSSVWCHHWYTQSRSLLKTNYVQTVPIFWTFLSNI